MSYHHNLDISPDPEKVLYINESDIADLSLIELQETGSDRKQDDNVRVYVPLDLNQSAILRRLESLGHRLGRPTEFNDSNYSLEMRGIISQLEIYDQVWYVREGDYPSTPDGYQHCRHAKELVEKILDVLESWAEKSSSESFPYNTIDELEEEYEITRKHKWK